MRSVRGPSARSFNPGRPAVRPASTCSAASPTENLPMKRKRQPHRTILRLEALEDRYLLSAGVLDPTFGAGGTVTTGFGNNTNTSARVLVIQPDGKLIAAGDSENPATTSVGYYDLARYNPDGSLDNTFGSKGEVQTK